LSPDFAGAEARWLAAAAAIEEADGEEEPRSR
jgi:hypothetical protein